MRGLQVLEMGKLAHRRRDGPRQLPSAKKPMWEDECDQPLIYVQYAQSGGIKRIDLVEMVGKQGHEKNREGNLKHLFYLGGKALCCID